MSRPQGPVSARHRLPTNRGPAISERTILLIAAGLIVLDLALFVVPIVPLVMAYVLVVRPPWFKAFVDDLYDSS